MQVETLTVSYVLMLIGGGSAGTAGGIRVTTFFLLGFVVLAEARGERDVTAFRRRISSDVQRQALSIVLLAVGVVGPATLLLLSITDFELRDVLFETSRPSRPSGCRPASPRRCRRPGSSFSSS